MFVFDPEVFRATGKACSIPRLDLREPGSAALSALAGERLGKRFRLWRGASGRKYMFSVYSGDACPAYDHAVLIGAAIETDGTRRFLFIEDTGAFPEAMLGCARAALANTLARIEFHIHLLAESPSARLAAIDDLAPPPEFAPWPLSWAESHSRSPS